MDAFRVRVGACALLAAIACQVMAGSDTATRIVERFLGNSQGTVTLRPAGDVGGHRPKGVTRYLLTVKRPDRNPERRGVMEKGFVTVDSRLAMVTSITFANRLAAANREAYSASKARALQRTALAFARRSATTASLLQGQPQVTLVDGRVYAYTWEGHTGREGVASGARIGIGVASATGEVVSYTCWLPVRPTALTAVRVSEPEARRCLCHAGFAAVDLSERGLLVLNSPMSPSEGPVWAFRVLHAGKAVDMAVVDAMTGKLIAPDAKQVTPSK